MLIRHLWDILLLFLNIFGILLSNLFSLFKPLKLNHLDTFATDCTCRGEHKRTRMHCSFYSHYYKYTVKDFTISLSTALHQLRHFSSAFFVGAQLFLWTHISPTVKGTFTLACMITLYQEGNNTSLMANYKTFNSNLKCHFKSVALWVACSINNSRQMTCPSTVSEKWFLTLFD